MNMNKIILNAANRGCNLLLSHTIKANYYKMGVRNFLFTTGNDGFDATAVMIECIGNLFYGEFKSGFGGNVIGIHGECLALTTLLTRYGGLQIMIEYD